MQKNTKTILERDSDNKELKKLAAMMAIINKRWLTMGWRMLEVEDARIMAQAWIEVFDAAGIPPECYAELYRRTLIYNSSCIANNLEIKQFNAELMIAVWKMYKAEIMAVLNLQKPEPKLPKSECNKCFGTRIEIVEAKGARPCKFC